LPKEKKMTLKLEDFIAGAGDSDVERKLGASLRKLPEEKRLQIVQELIGVKDSKCFRAALRFVKSSLHQPKSLITILNQGLEQADASVIRDWIGAVVPGLGFRRVVGELSRKVESDPKSVIRARYWLPRWIPDGDESAVKFVGHLDQLIEHRVKDTPDLLEQLQQVRVVLTKV